MYNIQQLTGLVEDMRRKLDPQEEDAAKLRAYLLPGRKGPNKRRSLQSERDLIRRLEVCGEEGRGERREERRKRGRKMPPEYGNISIVCL